MLYYCNENLMRILTENNRNSKHYSSKIKHSDTLQKWKFRQKMSHCQNIHFSLCKFLEGEMWPGRVFTHEHLSFISLCPAFSSDLTNSTNLTNRNTSKCAQGCEEALWQMDSCCRRVTWPHKGFKHHVWAVDEYYIKHLESFLVMNLRLCS